MGIKFVTSSVQIKLQSTLVNSTMHNSILSLISTQWPGPCIFPIYNCNSTTSKSIKLITRYEKLVPLINLSVFYNA